MPVLAIEGGKRCPALARFLARDEALQPDRAESVAPKPSIRLAMRCAKPAADEVELRHAARRLQGRSPSPPHRLFHEGETVQGTASRRRHRG
jgi:hypothetical protein